jgi:hypothetical protein
MLDQHVRAGREILATKIENSFRGSDPKGDRVTDVGIRNRLHIVVTRIACWEHGYALSLGHIIPRSAVKPSRFERCPENCGSLVTE